jgi:tetratricopeptide (TPR) repeat protein
VRGIERVYAGDRGGLEDIVKSIELAHASGSAGVLARCLNTIAVAYQVLGEPGLGLVERLEALAVSEQVGSPSLLQWFDGVLADHHYRVGQWVEAARLADSFLAAVDAGSPNVVAYQVYAVRAELRIATGDLDGARGDGEATLLAGRGAGEVQALGYALSAAAHVFASAGATERAVVVARELLDALDHGFPMQFAAVNLPMFAAAVTRVGLGERLPAALDSHPRTVWTDIVCDYAAGDFAAAADRLQVIGATPDEAEARRRAAEQLADEGRRDEADEQLRGALAFYRSVGATAYVRECEGSLSLR